MTNKLIKWTIILAASVAVLLPLWAHVRNASLESSTPMAYLFPMFGLFAAGLLWLHAISGVFEEWLRSRFDFDTFVHWTSLAILVSIILHPLLLLILIRFDIKLLLSGSPLAISLGIVGFLLLITYDIGKALKPRQFFVHHWNGILVLSTVGFLLTFFHSLMIGSDLQSGFLRYLWIFYGITALLATIYTYGIKKYLFARN